MEKIKLQHTNYDKGDFEIFRKIKQNFPELIPKKIS